MSNRIRPWILPLVLFVITALFVANIVAVSVQSDSWVARIGLLITVVPLIWTAYQVGINLNVGVYLGVQRLWTWIWPGTIEWAISVRMDSPNIELSTLNNIIDALRKFERDDERVKVQRVNASRALVMLPFGPVVELTFYGSHGDDWESGGYSSGEYVVCTVTQPRVSRREVARLVRQEVKPILEMIQKSVANGEMTCSMSIYFGDSPNPFYGLFIANLPPNTVADYSIQLRPHGIDHHTSIQVTKTKILIDSNSREEISDLALEFLTFNSNLKEHLAK